MLQQKQYVTPVYNLKIIDYQQYKIPVDLQNILNPLIKMLVKLDIHLNFEGYCNGLLFYYIKELDIYTPEKRQITDNILKLIKLSARDINLVEIIK